MPPLQLDLTADASVESAVARLSTEFGCRRRSTIEPLVTACRRDLAGAPPGALPELVERLARQRLLGRPPDVDAAEQ